MINKTYTRSMILLFSFFTLLSCKKDEFVNLSSSISGESNRLGTEEGGSVIANVLLTEELSEDLPIQLSIETDGILSYINDNDYNSKIEYSNDLGKTWKQAFNQKVIFEERNRNLKIRINTHDDQRIEFHEEFDLVFTPDLGSGLMLTGQIDPVRVTVEDNEPNEFGIQASGALYGVDENYNFTLIGLNRDAAIVNEAHKAMIDEGLDPRLIADITKVTQSGEVPITKFEAIYENSGLGGFVFNDTFDPTSDEWYMALNLLFAYHQQLETGEVETIDYNSNGVFGGILTHEYGHILTLNKLKQIDTSTDLENCTELSLSEGCFHSQSILNQFSEAFYESDVVYNEPHFVTDYAKTNIAEDIAETFTYHVLQNEIPSLTEESSGALQKMHLVGDHPDMSELRDKIRNGLSHATKSISPGNFSEPIRNFNLTKEGKRISCTDHHAVREAIQKRQFKPIQ
jgi:hypothetical protein